MVRGNSRPLIPDVGKEITCEDGRNCYIPGLGYVDTYDYVRGGDDNDGIKFAIQRTSGGSIDGGSEDDSDKNNDSDDNNIAQGLEEASGDGPQDSLALAP